MALLPHRRLREGRPPVVLASAQGCYRDMRLLARNPDMTKRWENYYPDNPDDKFDGPRSSHSNAIMDLDRSRGKVAQDALRERGFPEPRAIQGIFTPFTRSCGMLRGPGGPCS